MQSVSILPLNPFYTVPKLHQMVQKGPKTAKTLSPQNFRLRRLYLFISQTGVGVRTLTLVIGAGFSEWHKPYA